jgi:hypothetical protein
MAKKKKAKKAKKTKRGRGKPVRKRARPTAPNRKKAQRNGKLDEGLRETFPGSDPIAVTDPTRSIKE